MVILSHVTVAIVSVIFSTFVFARPSKNRFYFSYILIGITIASGTFLTLKNPAHMLQSCAMGIVYVGIVTFALVKARHKLATSSSASSF